MAIFVEKTVGRLLVIDSLGINWDENPFALFRPDLSVFKIT
ncbi:MAG: hypothetical protein P8L44_22830 [Opitutales bacterium]|nr:hypothetical protein [Opitutales bacterium]